MSGRISTSPVSPITGTRRKDPDGKIRAIAAYLAKVPQASRIEIGTACNINSGATGYYLRGLVKLGAVRRSRRTCGARYTWVGPLPPILAVIRASRVPSRRGRLSRAKLNIEQVIMICARKWVGGESSKRIAKDYGVRPSAVDALMSGRSHRRIVNTMRELHERGRLTEVYVGSSVADIASAAATARKVS